MLADKNSGFGPQPRESWQNETIERALLVEVDLGERSRASRAAAAARRARAPLSEPDPTDAPAPVLPVEAPGLDVEESLAEFRELVLSAGAQIAAEIIQRRSQPDPATFVGTGKVEEIAALAESSEADLIIFGADLTPTQLRNLEKALPCRVLDRTQLILDIFARHARTREGQLQVELAQLEYMLPRLTGRGRAMSQLGGGIGTRGPGETKLETDRRRIQKRLDLLKEDLETVRRVRRQQRRRREATPVPTVALVGYTNAGKSTLFNKITGAEVLQSSRMFATLDPKLRSIELPSRRKILLSDTVGFIRNLPHTLVTSFRATLEEVEQAEILLHVRDVASTYADEQKSQVERVLGELEALSKPRIEILNKADLLPPHELEGLGQRLASDASGTATVLLSAKSGQGIDALLEAIDRALVLDPVLEADFEIPQKEGAALASIEAGMRILHREFEGNLVRLHVAGPASLIGRLRRFRRNARSAATGESILEPALIEHQDFQQKDE